jgi:MYXO-CTERM domain-containing protein
MKTGFLVALLTLGLCPAVALAEPDMFGLGTGRDGPLTVTSGGKVINSYAQVTGPLAPGDTLLWVAGTEGFASGDLVMVLQVTGLVPEPAPGVSRPIDLTEDNVGRWELARVARVEEGTLALTAPLVHSYAARVTQVIRVPEYTSVRILKGGSLQAVPWDGRTGGVVAFLANEAMHNDGEVSASGAGFRGGRYVPDGSAALRCEGLAEMDRAAGQKGEGVASTHYGADRTGRYVVSNGGGGGVCPMAGGGGGGNGGRGGQGGAAAELVEGERDIGGQGGAPLTYSLLDRLSFGGGGGSGHGEDWSLPNGGAGGGAVFIRAHALLGSGAFVADGEPGGSASTGGGGGGGAGGSIVLRLAESMRCGSISARGGAGGRAGTSLAMPAGAGAGGGGGRVLLQAVGGDCSPFVQGGLAGSEGTAASEGSTTRLLEGYGVIRVLANGIVVTQPLNGSYVTTNTPVIGGGWSGPSGYSIKLILDNNAQRPIVVGVSVKDTPWSYMLLDALQEGEHKVYAEASGGVPPNTNTYTSELITFYVDGTPPGTNIDSGPASRVNSKIATFSFSSGDADVEETFECSLDSSLYVGCISPLTVSLENQPDGTHTFQVRAKDRAGNVDASPATHTWTIDTAGPTSQLDAVPPVWTTQTSVQFKFSSSAPDFAEFFCKLDTGAEEACGSQKSSQKVYSVSEGEHTFVVYAKDGQGNLGEAVSHVWTVDRTSPDTFFLGTPSNPSNLRSAEFRFGSNENASLKSFKCRLGTSGPFNGCPNPTTVPNLSDGQTYTLEVIAVDQADNEDPTPARWQWTVDLSDPETSITSGPALWTQELSASFVFSSPDKTASFLCELDAQGYTPCTSPASFTVSVQGRHVFRVRAKDPAGNEDLSPAIHEWNVDRTPPEVVISAGPSARTNSPDASFSFSSTDAVEVYDCQMDGQITSPCVSPKAYTGLGEGTHTFQVRAKDRAGNLGGWTSHVWEIDLTGPDTILDPASLPKHPTNVPSATFSFSSQDADVKQFECKLNTGSYVVCTSPTSYSSLPNGSYTFSVRAVDKTGTPDPVPATHSWVIDTVKPNVYVVKPADGGFASSGAPTFEGTVDDAFSTVHVYVDGVFVGTVPAAGDGKWSLPTSLNLSAGQHTVSAHAVDPAGNEGPRSTPNTFTVDLEPPETIIVEKPPKTHNSRFATFVFESPTGDKQFECQIASIPEFATFKACDATHVFVLPKPGDGVHTLEVRAKDVAGNVDPTHEVYEWTVVIRLPGLPDISEPFQDAVVDSETLVIKGTAVPKSTVTLYVDEEKVGVALADDAGTWTFRPTDPLAEGQHLLSGETTDEAGNTSEGRSPPRSFTVVLGSNIIGGGLSCATAGAPPDVLLLALGGLALLGLLRRGRR